MIIWYDRDTRWSYFNRVRWVWMDNGLGNSDSNSRYSTSTIFTTQERNDTGNVTSNMRNDVGRWSSHVPWCIHIKIISHLFVISKCWGQVQVFPVGRLTNHGFYQLCCKRMVLQTNACDEGWLPHPLSLSGWLQIRFWLIEHGSVGSIPF